MTESIRPEEPFTYGEIGEALQGVDPAVQQTVLGALGRMHERREALLGERAQLRTVFEFAAMFYRATDERADDSNIEGWTEETQDKAIEVLGHFAGRPPRTQTAMAVRDVAALSLVFMKCDSHDTDWDPELLEKAGTSTAEIYKKMLDGHADFLREVGRKDAEEQAVQEYPNLESFSGKVYLELWKHTVALPGEIMRSWLIGDGFPLPELDEDGMYGEDDEIDVKPLIDQYESSKDSIRF